MNRAPKASVANAGLIILDGDDTLWRTQHLFTQARRECMRTVKACGLNPRRWLTLQVEIDSKLTETYHFSREQFPTACREAYLQLAAEAGYSTDAVIAEQLHGIAATVFTARSQVYPGTERALRRLHDAGYRLVLLTKGDAQIQSQRIVDSGLGACLDEVVIVGGKTAEMFRGICAWAGVAPHRAISVGNSLRSDIGPAVSIGMEGFHLPHETWAYEKGGAPLPANARVTTVKRLSEVVTELERRTVGGAAEVRPGQDLAA